jgi:hypothetical protein
VVEDVLCVSESILTVCVDAAELFLDIYFLADMLMVPFLKDICALKIRILLPIPLDAGTEQYPKDAPDITYLLKEAFDNTIDDKDILRQALLAKAAEWHNWLKKDASYMLFLEENNTILARLVGLLHGDKGGPCMFRPPGSKEAKNHLWCYSCGRSHYRVGGCSYVH